MACDILLILRVQVISEDLALEEAPPAFLILLEVLNQRAKELVLVSIYAQLVPDGVGKPLFTDVGEAERVVKACHRFDQHLVLHAV
mmetsp:Transcript_16251/g.21988  ORF Transcript_16251/g.21988 Transcript_16251/m.21988 type:complete len:86 (+) Transcript_16251:666-923(+)|eukprot:CAMPEP_0170468286 /NCGR_PEP_ID=MMETSP0123-20130129/11525_1 /TAXON_ID=182087 /ORGANISM="Favella ehrenbergii, Strain Fehren 1" /LENGTH=85 /DNA_ID=CAMNT_0010734821 /DNA_START=2648 /DNA_END=2905 /DNA_ORIENTATION=-